MAELVEKRVAEAGPVSSALLELNYLFFDDGVERAQVDHRLRYERGPGSGENTWQVHSDALGVGHFTLVREEGRGPVAHTATR